MLLEIHAHHCHQKENCTKMIGCDAISSVQFSAFGGTNLSDPTSRQVWDAILIENAREELPSGKITAIVVKNDGSRVAIELTHKLSEEDVRIILAGGMLNC